MVRLDKTDPATIKMMRDPSLSILDILDALNIHEEYRYADSQVVYRYRATNLPDVKFKRSKRARPPAWYDDPAVVACLLSTELTLEEKAAKLGHLSQTGTLTRERVRQIIKSIGGITGRSLQTIRMSAMAAEAAKNKAAQQEARRQRLVAMAEHRQAKLAQMVDVYNSCDNYNEAISKLMSLTGMTRKSCEVRVVNARAAGYDFKFFNKKKSQWHYATAKKPLWTHTSTPS